MLRAFLASSLLSCGLRNNGFDERRAATVKIGSRQEKTAASTSIYRI